MKARCFFWLISITISSFFYPALWGQGIDLDTVAVDSAHSFRVVAEPAFVYAPAVRVPLAVTSIGQDLIEKNSEPTIEPLLNAVPGIWMQTGALNTNRISIRGVGYREPFATTGIKVYLDEIPLTNGAGESSIEDIHPFLFSSIYIWRGPASVLWGSGLGGMIHLKSRVPESDQWRIDLQTGSFNRQRVDNQLSLRYGKSRQISSLLHYQYLRDDGYRDNNEYLKHSWTWMQQAQLGSGFSIKSFLHGIDLKAFIPSSLNETDYRLNPSIAAPAWEAVRGNEDYTKWIAGLHFSYSRSDRWSCHGSFFGTLFNSDEVRPFNVLHEKIISYGTRQRLSYYASRDLIFSAGIELFNEKYSFSTFETLMNGDAGAPLADYKEDRFYGNGFIQSEIDLDKKWLLFGGIHLSTQKLSGNDQQSELPAGIFPVLGLSYIPKHHVTLSASVSRGYSHFSLDDIINSEGLITPGIKPETGWNKEISFTIGQLNASFGSIHLFHMDIVNSINTVRIADDVFEKVNSGRSVHQGIELEYRLDLEKVIRLSGSYTLSDFRFNETDNHKYLPAAPKHRAFNRLSILCPFLDIYFAHHMVSGVYLTDANSIRSDGYQVWNGGLEHEWKTGKSWTLIFSGTVQNIFDTKHASMIQINAPSAGGLAPRYYYPGKPRSIYLGLKVVHTLSNL